MRCPICGYADSKVLDSRPTEAGSVIRRRRECLRCSQRFTTHEKVEEMPIWVMKKDGRREIYNRQKLLNGILTACEKRPIPLTTLEDLVDEIELEMRSHQEGEVTSVQIGEAVMNRLHHIDEIAYVRFASVYRQFTDLQKFREELEKLKGNGRD